MWSAVIIVSKFDTIMTTAAMQLSVQVALLNVSKSDVSVTGFDSSVLDDLSNIDTAFFADVSKLDTAFFS
jgi:hypothetical protein